MAQGSAQFTVDDLWTEALQRAVIQKSYEHAALAVQTTRDQMAALVQQAAEDGQSTAELAKAIRDTFDFNEKVRSLRIARTEMTGTINDATDYSLKKQGYREKKWSTVIDGKERPDHADANGQVASIDGLFTVGSYSCRFPGDDVLPPSESVNCRCTLVGSGVPDDRIQKLGKMFLRIHGKLENRFVVSLRRAFLAERDRILSRL